MVLEAMVGAVNTKGMTGALGETFECISSHSPGYKVGRQYTVVGDEKGTLGFVGSDGYFDPLFNLVSKFKKVTPVE